MSGKFALIIGNTEYTDPGLAQLTAPGKDAEDFARVLKDRGICAFDEVNIILNQPEYIVREAIDAFFDQKKPDDLLVLYFSGHGVRDELGALYLAVKNTNRFRLRATAIKSDYIRESMDQSRSKRQVLILDCCNSGAYAHGTKAATGVSIGTSTAFESGYGRIILTASDSTQFAWEGDQVIGATDNSLFTHFLVEGLEGAADLDGDGRITVDELYDYAYEKVKLATPKQTPSKFSSKQQGEIIFRQNIPIEETRPVPLSEDLIAAIKSSLTYVREGAVRQLEELLNGRNLSLARSAREALERIEKDDDSRRVSQLATQALELLRQAEHSALQKAEEERKAKREAKRLAVLKAKEERLTHEKADAERKARELAERLLVEQKAEEERKAREEAERIALQKAEQENLAREKVEAEQKAKEKADRLAKQKAEEERKAREEAERLTILKAEEERLAREKAEAERKAIEETEQKAKEEAQRLLAEQKAEAEQRAREEAEQQAKEEAERLLTEQKAKEERGAGEAEEQLVIQKTEEEQLALAEKVAKEERTAKAKQALDILAEHRFANLREESPSIEKTAHKEATEHVHYDSHTTNFTTVDPGRALTTADHLSARDRTSKLWFRDMLAVITRPTEKTFLAVASQPNINVRKVYFGIFIGGFAYTFIINTLALILTLLGIQVSSFWSTFSGDLVMNIFYFVGMLGLAVAVGLLLLLFFRISTAFIQWATKRLGGSGTLDKTIYVFGTIAIPTMAISLLIEPFGWIPGIGALTPILTGSLGVYVLFLQIAGTKAVHNLSWMRATASVLLPLLVIFAIVGCALSVLIFLYLTNLSG